MVHLHIYKYKILYLHRLLSKTLCVFSFTPLSFLFVNRDGIFTSYPRTDFTLSEFFFLCYDLKEFVFSHDKAACSLKEYFHALEMDKTHIYVVFTY